MIGTAAVSWRQPGEQERYESAEQLTHDMACHERADGPAGQDTAMRELGENRGRSGEGQCGAHSAATPRVAGACSNRLTKSLRGVR